MITGISISCEATKGVFASEYFVRIKMINGDTWNGSVDKEMILDLNREPKEDEYVSGRMYAYLIDFNSNSALIELPVEDSARRIIVPFSSVRKEKIPA